MVGWADALRLSGWMSVVYNKLASAIGLQALGVYNGKSEAGVCFLCVGF